MAHTPILSTGGLSQFEVAVVAVVVVVIIVSVVPVLALVRHAHVARCLARGPQPQVLENAPDDARVVD
jgi:hypothetical protein